MNHSIQREPSETRQRADASRRYAVPTVLLAGKLDALDAPGGGEVQMLAMAATLPSVGVGARMWRPWEETLDEVDCLHLFGSVPEHLPIVAAARRRNVRVALSPIAWFDWKNTVREPRSPLRRVAACARFAARAACPRLPSWRRTLYHDVDLLLPNSNAEAEQLTRYFQVPSDRVQVVPNGADPRFADASAEAFVRHVGTRDFVLCPGRIEPRKGQLGLLRALRATDTPVVILGNVVPGHEEYMQACRRAAGDRVRFVPAVAHDDPLLASAYAACGCLVLASWFETPGLVSLEAAMTGTPLVLPEGGCASEYFGSLASYVRPDDRSGIHRAVLRALRRGRSEALAQLAKSSFTWTAAAEATRRAYETTL